MKALLAILALITIFILTSWSGYILITDGFRLIDIAIFAFCIFALVQAYRKIMIILNK